MISEQRSPFFIGLLRLPLCVLPTHIWTYYLIDPPAYYPSYQPSYIPTYRTYLGSIGYPGETQSERSQSSSIHNWFIADFQWMTQKLVAVGKFVRVRPRGEMM
jgi:hypothetical protein